MRTILLIVTIVIMIVPGCADTGNVRKTAANNREVYNSPTLWQSFKSIHMAQKKKETPAPEKKLAMGTRVKRLVNSMVGKDDRTTKK